MRSAWRLIRRLGMPFWASGMVLIVLLVGLSSLSASAADDVGDPVVLGLSYQSAQVPLCRFGVGAQPKVSIADFDIAPLRLGWYVDWKASASPPRPNGIQYVPTIRLDQLGADSYTYWPRGSQLQQAISTNPGADWLIGNEPDRIGPWQDDMAPGVYARAYHELYYLIKAADPTAHIFAGGIVQPTAVRLEYLDIVLDSYWDLYSETLPADGWNIHNFVLNEVSCDYDPDNCWGAEVPRGVDAPYGEVLTIDDNDDFELFKQRIVRFRQWMMDRGYGGLPVYLSEYGVQMPPDYGFPPERVNAFMEKTFDYLRTAKDPVLGNPADGYRLVQRWAWWSLIDVSSNGWLFDPNTYDRTVYGDYWAAYTAQLSSTVDLYPVRIFADPPVPYSQGGPVTFTLQASIANSGNVSSTLPITVRFYDGDPAGGGVQIGTDQVIPPLSGCGDSHVTQVEWPDVAAGVHVVYVSVDPVGVIPEADEYNNTVAQVILVATHRISLPLVNKMASP